jgi:hypothetical protein
VTDELRACPFCGSDTRWLLDEPTCVVIGCGNATCPSQARVSDGILETHHAPQVYRESAVEKWNQWVESIEESIAARTEERE